MKLDTVGKILKGDQVGWYVKVEYDADSGGYYIYQFKNKVGENGLGEAYDDWLESLEDVHRRELNPKSKKPIFD